MFERLRPALVITRREVRDQLRDWRIILPVVVLTVFFPFLMNFTAQRMLAFVNQYGADIIGERLIPFLMMIVGFFPISVSLVIALETFVGEKERGSIEPLLNTPLEDWQLYLGKLLAAVVPPVFTSYLGMAVYVIGLAVDHIPLPEFNVLAQVLTLTTVQAVMMVSGAVVVSAQSTSVRAANLLASFIVIPVALLIQGESILIFWGTNRALWWAVLGISVLTLLLMRVGLAHFRREELLGRQIDVLNIRWGWQLFRDAFTGGARNVGEWYLKTLPRTVRGMGASIGVVSVLAVVAGVIGLGLVKRFMIPLDQTSLQDLDERVNSILKIWPLFSFAPVLAIWWQNVRVMLLAMVVGLFSFGILGMLPLIASLAVVGYLFGLLTANGISAVTYLGLVIPHGVLEIPAAILATAAVFQFGILLATPTQERTIGEVFIAAMADWAKVMIGIVLPVLLAAAGIEAWVTPRVAVWLLR